MSGRRLISSGGPYEARVGYSRAVRVGRHVYVAGTTAMQPDGTVAHAGDAGGQARVTLRAVLDALAEAGASAEQVVRTRMYIVDAAVQDAVGAAHGEVFAEVRPAATMVVVAGLVHPDMLVEIEAEAYLDAD